MSEKNIAEMVKVNGESDTNGDRWMMEKIMSDPCTITIPPSKTCTTGTRSQSLWVSIIEDDATAGVTFGPGRVECRLHSLSRVLVNSQELDPGASRDVLAAYLQVTSGQGSEGTVGLSVN